MMHSNTKHLNTIAAISDIHSNVFALEAVMADIKNRDVDQVVNLGDILYGPIAPKATYKLLMTYRDDIVTICGNQDRQIYEATEADIAANATLDLIVKKFA
ncbi:metallophosphoesterase family protein [Psychrobacter aquaticus]|uniref:Serine/threonine protein phosphatase n=1 Tax=Psychrobacter aquaticus CMS 56 TaxID=1354303 RepID=U4T3F4_9GAMM|nr:metallophosphoesterase family protein [Psychrobacter aquaticus]ERL54551.1 Serine/threonine protein phosphatase [Psychrobacter aquaticus CMS 56]